MQGDFPLKDFYGDIYTTYDRVNRIFTFGRDVVWRKRAAIACLEGNPGELLDVCTGTGDFVFEVARQAGLAGREIRLTGYDFSRSMLDEAERKLRIQKAQGGMQEIPFIEGDVGNMPFESDHFGAMGITFGIRNLVYENSNAGKHLKELYRGIKTGRPFCDTGKQPSGKIPLEAVQ